MAKLWDYLEQKLIKSGRKWRESPNYSPYRCAELFCEECGVSIGVYDICYTDLETIMYCPNCVKEYIKDTPIILDCGVILNDFGTVVNIEYKDNYYILQRVNKICYFNKKGRYIRVKGKRYYI